MSYGKGRIFIPYMICNALAKHSFDILNSISLSYFHLSRSAHSELKILLPQSNPCKSFTQNLKCSLFYTSALSLVMYKRLCSMRLNLTSFAIKKHHRSYEGGKSGHVCEARNQIWFTRFGFVMLSLCLSFHRVRQ